MATSHQRPRSTPPAAPARTLVSVSGIDETAIERALVYAFAPLHRWAFGLAIAVGATVAFLVITTIAVLRDPAHGLGIGLLAQYFPGFDITVVGIAAGAFWSAVVGFVAGWFVAFCRNLSLAIWLIYIRARNSLNQTHDILDHI